MLIINGKMMLKIDNEIINPGEKKDLPEKVAENLVKAGLAKKAKETAAMPTDENAVIPKPDKKRRKKSETEAGD